MVCLIHLLVLALLCGLVVTTRIKRCENVISRGKRTGQSSTYPRGQSLKAVDGKWNPNWSGQSCTHTQKQHLPYWWVHLGRKHQVSTVLIQNRADCCASRLSNVKVTVGDSLRRMHISCGYRQSPAAAGEVLVFNCPWYAVGNIVEVQLLKTDFLTMCEVTVYGSIL